VSGDYNTAIGYNAGKNNLGSENFFFGTSAGLGAVGSTGSSNVAIGKDSMSSMTTADSNVAIGKGALNNPTTASSNVCIGRDAGTSNSTGDNNVYIGFVAGSLTTSSAASNVMIGKFAGAFSSGNDSVCIGEQAGQSQTGSCVMLGRSAGSSETGTNKLYIANSNTATPLIHGDFTNKNLGFSTTDYAGGVGVQAIADATTIPAAVPVGGGVFYSNVGALYWKGSAGTVTLIAPA